MYPLISIIIPVYKTEKFLKDCVESIVIQSYGNLEIILVDDGSPDRCPEICDELSLQDNRIKAFHKPNGGVSSARNLGLEKATGEYICFVDSDDRLFPDSIMHLYNGIHTNECHFAAGICIDRASDYKTYENADVIVDFNKNPTYLLKYISRTGSYSPYAKIFKTSIIKENSIRYNENLKCCEDALFIRQYLKNCSRMALISKVVYHYNTDNVNSLSKKGYADFYLYYIEKLKALKELVAELPLTENQRSNYLSDRAIHGLYISIEHYFLNWSDKNTIVNYIDLCINAFDDWIDKSRTNANLTPKELKWWSKYQNLISSKKADKIYSKLYVCYLYKSFKRKVKNILIHISNNKEHI